MRDSSENARGDRPEPTAVGPGSAVAGLDEHELDALRAVGRRWSRAVAGRRAWLRALPVDPELPRFPRRVALPARRFVTVGVDDGEQPVARSRLQRLLIGAPLASSAVKQERMRKLVALPILSSDALSSVAYGPEAMIAVLALAGTSALGLSLPIAGVIVVLMIAVGRSYRQIVRAYPHGGGSYVVARDTLGEGPALVAAAGLLVDYLLTVAVSISAGVAAVTSAVPALAPDRVEIGLAVIGVLLLGNLRGVREAGALFSAPTYAFIAAIALLVAVGLVDAAGRGFAREQPPPIHAVESLTLLVALRAFSSGATAMTGIEAVSNAVPVFRDPAARNARTTLGVMVTLLVAMFAGLVVVMHLDGIVPSAHETMLSAAAHRHLSGPLYVFVQVSTALVLLLAANTAFNGFPRLLSMMARNGHAPRFFLRLGDRLVFSNGVFLLAGGAALVYAGFSGDTTSLIPLYAVGVFIAFTVSQAGMVVHWRRRRGRGWRGAAATNALGALLSGLVFLVAAATKLTAGAWVALVLIAGLSLLSWRIRRHYALVRAALSLEPLDRRGPRQRIVPHRAGGEADGDAQAERTVAPDELRHLAVVPVARLDRSSLRALAYAASLGHPVLAVHISPERAEGERFLGYWRIWGDHLPLHVVESPYRAIVAPAVRYLEALRAGRPELTLTVVLPELIVRHPWHAPLHNGTTRRLRRALRRESGVVVTTIGFHLPS